MPTPAKLEVILKIDQLPTEVTTDKNGWKRFTLDAGGRPVSVALRPRMWNKIEEFSKDHAVWVAAITGQMGQSEGKGFALAEPALQLFERKAPPQQPRPEEPPPPIG